VFQRWKWQVKWKVNTWWNFPFSYHTILQILIISLYLYLRQSPSHLSCTVLEPKSSWTQYLKCLFNECMKKMKWSYCISLIMSYEAMFVSTVFESLQEKHSQQLYSLYFIQWEITICFKIQIVLVLNFIR
jgi:hypothetical protein